MATEFKNIAGQTKAYTRSTKNVTKPEDSPEEKSKAQSDQISAKGKAAKEASERAASNSKAPQHDFKGDTSLDMTNPKSKSDIVSTPKAKPVAARTPVETSASKASRQAAYNDWKSSTNKHYEFFKSRGAFKDNEGMKKGGSVKAKSTCMKSESSQAAIGAPGMKKGGMVKSSASSRGDGCAQRGKTRGRFV